MRIWTVLAGMLPLGAVASCLPCARGCMCSTCKAALKLVLLPHPPPSPLPQVLPPSRYCEEPPNRLRGRPAAELMTLQALGWAVLPLPVREWQELEQEASGDAKALALTRERYLRARIAAALG